MIPDVNASPDVTASTILLVDDEEPNLDLLEAFLRPDGFQSLVRTSDARQALPLLESCRPDLVLLDLHMPHRTGFQILADIRERTPPGEYLPVLVLTADATWSAKQQALSGGARDFLTKPLQAVEVCLRVRNLLETRLLHRAQRAARERAEAQAASASLLAEASRLVGASFDTATALEQLARLLIQRFADVCVVQAVTGSESSGLVALVAAEPATESALRSQFATGGVLEVGEPGHRVAVPLAAAGRELGTLTVVRAVDRPAFETVDVELMAEVARRAGLALENARLFADAHRATRARDQVLAVVAHDMRNPLASIAMDAEMLRHLLPPEVGERQIQTVTRIERVAQRVHGLVDDLLEVSRTDRAATLEVSPRPVTIDAMFAEAEAMLAPLAGARDVALRFEAGEHTVYADPARVLQVLSNLVGNALKFTPGGGTIDVSAERAGEEVRVRVRDTGAGIAAEALSHIFDPYWQASPSDRTGVGLGLVIARAIVEAHGGTIDVESAAGTGTTFTFSLPLAQPETP